LASEEAGLEANAEKTKYVVMSGNQNTGQNKITICNESVETVDQFKYLGTTVMNQNSIHEEN
jgi:hypothetical protein